MLTFCHKDFPVSLLFCLAWLSIFVSCPCSLRHAPSSHSQDLPSSNLPPDALRLYTVHLTSPPTYTPVAISLISPAVTWLSPPTLICFHFLSSALPVRESGDLFHTLLSSSLKFRCCFPAICFGLQAFYYLSLDFKLDLYLP